MTTTPTRPNRRDSGFGLVELLVAMAILAIISLSLVPLLANGLKQSASNTTNATANQWAGQWIQIAASRPSTCSAFNSQGILSQQTKVDPRGVTLIATNTIAACPTGFPGTRVFTTTITRQDTGAVLVTASTLVYVSGS